MMQEECAFENYTLSKTKIVVFDRENRGNNYKFYNGDKKNPKQTDDLVNLIGCLLKIGK